MPSNSTGKWVARAASTGGGRTYRGQMPVNWYAALALLCVVGLALIGYSRYERTHQTASSSGPPTTSQTWYAALSVDICGKVQPNLPASTDQSVGFTTDGSGIVTVQPKNAGESGANATLGKFVSEYKKLTLTTTTVRYPGGRLFSSGERCPSGTPDAGKQGFVIVDEWPNFSATKSTEVPGDPRSLKFANGQMITVAFVPATKAVPKPPATVITNLIKAVTGAQTSVPTPVPTPVPSSVPSSVPSTTTPSTKTSTTTAPGGRAG